MKALFCFAAAALALAAAAPRAAAADAKTGFLDRTHGEAKYVLFVPHDYKGDKDYPLILFLHGAGERGADGEKPAKVGLGPAVRKREKTFPFFVVFPQAKSSWGANSADAKRALEILAAVQKEYKIDAKRVYLTGLSMGGFGTWGLAAKDPDRWAAIVPVCGGGDPATAKAIKDVPCWCFHGDADKAVPVGRSRMMIGALKEAGAKPRYDEYKGVGHNSWDKAYGTDELYEWLLMQKKK
jgi:predicted peptidase